MSESAQEIYGTSGESVRASFKDHESALAYYADLVKFALGISQPGKSLLDVGCGSGWSTFALAQAGFQATGIDLNPDAFEPPSGPFTLRQGSAMEIPFSDASFDVVVCYQCLEHVPDPERALHEMARVCRPGGIVAIVGPNLVSPIVGVAYIVKPSSWKTLSFRRRAGMPRHPYGNTVPEVLWAAMKRSGQLVRKLAQRTAQFSMREPDLTPPFHADNDACYLCNPTDLIRFFKSQGFQVIQCGKPGRPPLTYLVAGGTWVAARKPD